MLGAEMKPSNPSAQNGFFLIEALLSILIFSLGILGMVAISVRAMDARADAEYRTDAARFADEIASLITLNVDRSTPALTQSSLAAFAHQPTGTACGGFSGTASSIPFVTAWLGRLTAARTGLPGAVSTGQQIVVSTAATDFNRVTINLCWQAPSDTAVRRHTLITYVN
jgi:type IV pilus assembly protein PilV